MLSDALALSLSSVPDMLLLARYATEDPDLVRDVANLHPDVTVIDVEPLGSEAGALVAELREASPGGHVVVLTGSMDPKLAIDSARAGAVAWIDKASTTEHLIEVLRGVRDDRAWYPPEVLGPVLRALRGDAAAREQRSELIDSLSPREREVLRAIADGRSAEAIAGDLRISVNTVRTHTSSILAKLGVHSRLAAASVAAAHGLVPASARGAPRTDDVVQLVRKDDYLRSCDQ
jgi:DNA-binding NarL/FixJ family response regulator